MSKTLRSIVSLLFLAQSWGLYTVTAQTGPGPCHPYPGAGAQDCLKLISDNLNNGEVVPCTNQRATFTYQACTITTKCAQGQTDIDKDTAVRRALTTIGSCALNDYGSISGYYIADDGSKTCYLYPGNDGYC